MDSTGFDDSGLARSLHLFLESLKIGAAYAVVEAGEFQVYVQEYEVRG